MQRASRNVLLTLLGAGVVGGATWFATGGSSGDCRSVRYPNRETCEAARGAGQCAIDPAMNQWRAMDCRSSYVPRSYSHYWGGWGAGSSPRPAPTARSGSTGRVDAAPPASGRSGTASPGGSSRGGFGSVGASRSGSS